MKGHGEVRFVWRKDVLFVEAFGPFNEVAVVQVAEAYLKQVEGQELESFSVVEVWDKNSLGSPEVMDKVGQFWHYLQGTNCSALCIVVDSGIQKRLCEKLLPSIGRVFLSQEEAEQCMTAN